MSKVVIQVEGVSKQYRLGELGTGSFSEDIRKSWARFRGKEDPTLRVGQAPSTKGGLVMSLKDINFEVNQGDAVGIIGKNGAGKSTLLKILSRITAPTTGNLRVKGRLASLLEVGTGFHPELSGRDNIFLNGAILGMSKSEIKRKFDEIVEFSGVGQYIDTPVKRYSSGMYVRLAFAVAAHLESEILIVDEVLAVGDAEFQKKCLGKMKDVSRGEGRTVLFVSHNMTAINTLCNKGIYLKSGQLENIGNTSAIIKEYLQKSSIDNRYITFANIEKAIGNENIKILYAGVENGSKNKFDAIDVSTDIDIVFNLVNLTNEDTISVGFDLQTIKGDVLFGSGGKFECSLNKETTLICKIPKNFLNDDIYIVQAYFHSNGMRELYFNTELLTFEVHDKEREVGYLGKINGFVRTNLEWRKS